MTETETLIDLLKRKQPVCAMLAPSFPIVYDFPDIIKRLRRTGFSLIAEVSYGAKFTNASVVAALSADKKSRYVTSPCPSFVRMVRTKYPALVPYLALSIDSPMIATAKVIRNFYPQYRPIFIGPCNAKKFEANEDHPDLQIVSVTYQEMEQVFAAVPEDASIAGGPYRFDIEFGSTRLYPVSGGLAQSSAVRAILADDEVEVVSGWQSCQSAIERFLSGNRVRLLDILFCEGGCIHGPGIVSPLNLDERRAKIVRYWQQTAPASSA